MAVNISEIDKSIDVAQAILDAAPVEVVPVSHSFNYFSKQRARPHKERTEEDEENEHVIFTNPGQARSVEMRLPPPDLRVGAHPQHNSPGSYRSNFETIPSLTLNDYQNIHTYLCLEENGYIPKVASLTRKHIDRVAHQFANLSHRCFRDMMCLVDEAKRDFDVWLKVPEGHTEFVNYRDKEIPVNCDIDIAYINPRLQLIQYIQTVRYDTNLKLIDLRHVVFEAGLPLVANQSCFDKFGNLRNIAHVGVTGSETNAFQNSLERLDDGTIIWTSSDFKDGQKLTGAAILRENGQVILLEDGDKTMAEFSARNLGAEGINARTLAWTGNYSADACLAESEDKYIVRTEYKEAVRKQVYQIVDGACIPGPEPIFDPLRLL